MFFIHDVYLEKFIGLLRKPYKILIIISWALFFSVTWSLYRQIIHQPDLSVRWEQITNSWHHWKFWLVVILMGVNWGIETRKWQLLVHHVQPFSFLKSFKSVLSGCSITMITPNRIGEYGGRILYIKEENRIKGISLTLVGSISQLLVTMIMGCIGLLYLRYLSHKNSGASAVLPEFWGDVLIYLSLGLRLSLYFICDWLVGQNDEKNPLSKDCTHIKVWMSLIIEPYSDTVVIISTIHSGCISVYFAVAGVEVEVAAGALFLVNELFYL